MNIGPSGFTKLGTDSEGSDINGSDGENTSCISWYCGQRGNEFFYEVDDDYIQDEFDLCGLSSLISYYDYALELILDIESSHDWSSTKDFWSMQLWKLNCTNVEAITGWEAATTYVLSYDGPELILLT